MPKPEDDARKVKVFRLEVMVIDHDGLGERGVARELENVNFPNDCMSPEVAGSEWREVEWIDEHPLNRSDPAVWVPAFRELFSDAPLTRELVMDASLGVIPTMRLVASHLRNDDMVQSGEVNKIYAEKLTREAEALERYCQQLAIDLTRALSRPMDVQAHREICSVRDTLAGTPPRVKS